MINRRRFLKIIGVSTVYGIGMAATNSLIERLEASQFDKTPGRLTAKRWGMFIDMGKIKTEEDIKRIIIACHSIHNVPSFGNPKDEIKWIWTEEFKYAFPGQEDKYLVEGLEHKPFIVLCNHCENPPCVRVCPTKATFKRKEDGLVLMDYHRCIGCRYCMAGCPYGARSFNYRDPRPFIKEINPKFPTRMIGVVEKCTFCSERLDKGLIPACVEASNGAIVFGDLNDANSEIRRLLRDNYTIRRKPELGTRPGLYYKIGGAENV
jgi:molybdopterin-containing oxidoreductase family iron-sulfur binding subunit